MANHVRNALAGMAMAGLMLPEAVAYAGIAGLAPGRALIAAVVGGLAYAVIGRSRFAVVSPTSSSAAILAASLASLASGNGTTAANATALTLLIGVLFIGLAAARLGSLAGFVARPVLRGFALGLALTIIIRQMPALVGLPAPHGSVGVVAWALVAHGGNGTGLRWLAASPRWRCCWSCGAGRACRAR
ncbi:SulP family inorganic anion transporter [Novosphingobium pokkalii]|uniref:SulP family inorganic anion transporter n=1 Tax=Novosphingobium pokkalii TaxID=1770194 RepID=UPI003640491F